MKSKFLMLVLIGLTSTSSTYALPDLTGTYQCKGVDTQDGKFVGVDTMQLDMKNSTNKTAGYAFNAPGFQGGLSGFGVFDGQNLAVYFYSLDKSSEEAKQNYGVMIAHVFKNVINKVYYEPVYKGGSTGFVECVKISKKVDASLGAVGKRSHDQKPS